MERLHAQKMEGIEARRQREQRRRKLDVDNAIIQKEVEAKRQINALLNKLTSEADQERARARGLRNARHLRKSRADLGKAFVDYASQQQHRKFQQAVLRDRRRLAQAERP